MKSTDQYFTLQQNFLQEILTVKLTIIATLAMRWYEILFRAIRVYIKFINHNGCMQNCLVDPAMACANYL